jgi:DNA-binding CsgD family transcriptional regulator
VVSTNADGERWLAELHKTEGGDTALLPVSVRAAVAGKSTVRLRAASGTWVSIQATALLDAAGYAQTAVIIEPASRRDLASLFLDAQGLTPAQARVAALVLRGYSTRQIVNELRISQFTVQEHLRAVFDKFGVGSRRELVAALMA